nr:hypothetical protein GCM10020093_102910 [Planobispora longispora]
MDARGGVRGAELAGLAGSSGARSAGHSSTSRHAQDGSATGQRGWKEQPPGSRIGSGGSPPRPRGAMREAKSPTVGNASASALLYGCRAPVKTSRDGPVSTSRPAYITASRSHVAASTDRSCEIMIRLMPRPAMSERISVSTWAWIITSRAVVGSSAMISWGSQASAMAIITRWRCPPDSSCG